MRRVGTQADEERGTVKLSVLHWSSTRKDELRESPATASQREYVFNYCKRTSTDSKGHDYWIMAAPQASSRLEMLQARFQQKQLQEKEQKLLQLYDQQQQRAYQVAQRGTSGSNGSGQGLSTVSQHHQVVTRTSSSGNSTSTSQTTKVKQVFNERRQTSVKGIDRSYPLEPLDNKTRKPVLSNNSSNPRNNGVTDDRQSIIVKRVTRADVNSNVNDGKGMVTYQEEITQESSSNGVRSMESRKTFDTKELDNETITPRYLNGNHPDKVREFMDEDTIERNRMMAKLHLMQYDDTMKHRVRNDLESEEFPEEELLLIEVTDKLPKRTVSKKLSQAEARLERFKNMNAKRNNANKLSNATATTNKKRTDQLLPTRTTSRGSSNGVTTTTKTRTEQCRERRSNNSNAKVKYGQEAFERSKTGTKAIFQKRKADVIIDGPRFFSKESEKSLLNTQQRVVALVGSLQNAQNCPNPASNDNGRFNINRIKNRITSPSLGHQKSTSSTKSPVESKTFYRNIEKRRKSPEFFCIESDRSGTTMSLKPVSSDEDRHDGGAVSKDFRLSRKMIPKQSPSYLKMERKIRTSSKGSETSDRDSSSGSKSPRRSHSPLRSTELIRGIMKNYQVNVDEDPFKIDSTEYSPQHFETPTDKKSHVDLIKSAPKDTTNLTPSSKITKVTTPQSSPKSPKSFTSIEVDTEIHEITMTDQHVPFKDAKPQQKNSFSTYTKSSALKSRFKPKPTSGNPVTYSVRREGRKRSSILDPNAFHSTKSSSIDSINKIVSSPKNPIKKESLRSTASSPSSTEDNLTKRQGTKESLGSRSSSPDNIKGQCTNVTLEDKTFDDSRRDQPVPSKDAKPQQKNSFSTYRKSSPLKSRSILHPKSNNRSSNLKSSNTNSKLINKIVSSPKNLIKKESPASSASSTEHNITKNQNTKVTLKDMTFDDFKPKPNPITYSVRREGKKRSPIQPNKIQKSSNQSLNLKSFSTNSKLINKIVSSPKNPIKKKSPASSKGPTTTVTLKDITFNDSRSETSERSTSPLHKRLLRTSREEIKSPGTKEELLRSTELIRSVINAQNKLEYIPTPSSTKGMDYYGRTDSVESALKRFDSIGIDYDYQDNISHDCVDNTGSKELTGNVSILKRPATKRPVQPKKGQTITKNKRIAEARDSLEITRPKSRSPSCKRSLFPNFQKEMKCSSRSNSKDTTSDPKANDTLMGFMEISAKGEKHEDLDRAFSVKPLRSIEDIRKSIVSTTGETTALTQITDIDPASTVETGSAIANQILKTSTKSEKQSRIVGDPVNRSKRYSSIGRSKNADCPNYQEILAKSSMPVDRVVKSSSVESTGLKKSLEMDSRPGGVRRTVTPSKSPEIFNKQKTIPTKSTDSTAFKRPFTKTDVANNGSAILQNGLHTQERIVDRKEESSEVPKKSQAFTINLEERSSLKKNDTVDSKSPLTKKQSVEQQLSSATAGRPTSSTSTSSSGSTTQAHVSNNSKGRMAMRTRTPISGVQTTKGNPAVKSTTNQCNTDNLIACKVCGRRFAQDRISLHERICTKTVQKKRKQFDTTMYRIKGTDLEAFAKKCAKKCDKTKKPEIKTNWRRKHEEFISAIRSAKQVQAHLAAGGRLSDLPPPPVSDTSDYIQCPHCGRKFNQAAAERHIPKCEHMQHNKPSLRAPPRPRR